MISFVCEGYDITMKISDIFICYGNYSFAQDTRLDTQVDTLTKTVSQKNRVFQKRPVSGSGWCPFAQPHFGAKSYMGVPSRDVDFFVSTFPG